MSDGVTQDANPRRRLWQFHLSTAICMMFIAAMFLYINVRSHRASREHSSETPDLSIDEELLHFGWPFVYRAQYRSIIVPKSNAAGLADTFRRLNPNNEIAVEPNGDVQVYEPSEFKTLNGIFNVLTIVPILLGIGVLIEWLIRRREASF